MAPDEFLKAIHTIGPFRHPAEGSPFNETLVAEVAIWTAILGVTVALLIIQPKFVEDVEAALKRLARRPALACITVGLAALALRLALLPLIPYPVPKYHDEYSYILQAQTFAAGRVANPAHPLWVHFETFHVNMLPTYASMYPPAQATFLAIGQVFTGKPWWGVWLSIGILCACVTWMLQAWMPAPWALLGGLFCLLRYGLFSYWVNSYWGGAAAAIGGALLFGALPRLMRRPRVSLAIIIALALMILANSRPYEGFIFAVPSMLWLLAWIVRKQTWNLRFAKQAVVPAALVLILGAGFMLYYNWRCTGHPTLMPYMLNQATYHISKPFLWQKPNPIPNYHHLVMRTFYCFHELPYAVRARTAWGIQELTEEKFGVYYGFFIWPLLLLFIPAMWQIMKSRRARVLGITLLFMLAGLLIEAWPPHGHYAAPIACVVIAIMLYGLRLLRTWNLAGRPVGLMMVRAIVIVMIAWSAFVTANTAMNPWNLEQDQQGLPPEFERARIQAQLEHMPGQHLLLVHTRRGWTGTDEWVYNEADIDHAKVIWARDMGTEGNKELLDYYPQRQVWIVDQNDGIMRVMAYNGHSSEDTMASAVGLPPRKTQN